MSDESRPPFSMSTAIEALELFSRNISNRLPVFPSISREANVPMMTANPNNYQPGREYSEAELEAGEHREAVGGRWDEIGDLQYSFLVENGLHPQHRLLDIGCGSLRAGVRLVDYLEPGNYFGTDLVEGLLDAGRFEVEKAGLAHKLPYVNLAQVNRLEVPFDTEFDFAVAQSLWSHLPLNHIKLCLANLRPKMKADGTFFATIFVIPASEDLTFTRKDGQYSYESDRFMYPVEDMRYAARSTGWSFDFLNKWDHPRGQRMCVFTPTHPDRAI